MGVGIETVLDKGVEFTAPTRGIFEALDGFVLELPHGDEWFEVGVGYYPLGQFDSCDPQ